MDEAIEEELKLGELLRNDILRELDVIQTISSSLLVLDLKRKHIESHFESLEKMIERKRDEAIEEIRVREEKRLEELRMKEVRIERLRKGVFGEIFVRSRGIDEEMEKMESFEKRLKAWEEEIERRVKEIEVREKETEWRGVEIEIWEKEIQRRGAEVKVREKEIECRGMEVETREKEIQRRVAEVEVREKEIECRGVEVETWEKEIQRRGAELEVREKEIERRVAEWEVKEKEMDEVKKYVDRLCVGLTRKEREINGLKKVMDELKLEGERHGAECRKLADENLGLREEVKVLTEKLVVKSKVHGREEQLKAIHNFLHVLTSAGIISICNPIKESELSGQELFITARDSVNNQGAAISKVSSLLFEARDNASTLVVEALKISYLNESDEKKSKSFLTQCRILMLEQLGHLCPQQKSQVRHEALRVAKEHSAQIETCGLKPVEISRFLQFVSLYDIASEFSDEVLMPMLHCVAVLKGMPDFCFTLGFSNRITGYIKTMIENKQQLKALEYISTFKMTNEFSVVKIIQGHLKGLSNSCQKILSEVVDRNAAEVQVLDSQIATLKELIECINDLKLQRIYTTGDLEERLANLEKQKYQNKRPAACIDPSNDLEPQRKKGCNLPGTAKSPEPNPTISNIHPKVGSRDLPCFGPSRNSDPSAKNICKFPETAKSAEVTAKASDAYPEVRSGTSFSSNHKGHTEPAWKKECELPGTRNKMEVAQNSPNANQETESGDVVSSTTNNDAEPLRSNGYNLNGTAKVNEVASTTPNVQPKFVTRKVLGSKPNNCIPGCTLPQPMKPHDMSPKATINAYPEIRARNLLSSTANNFLQPQLKNECKLPRQTRLMEEIGSRDIFRSKPENYPEPVMNKAYELPGTAKLREVVLNANNPYPKIVPKDVPCSKPNINPDPWKTKRCNNFHEVPKPQETATAPKGTLNAYTESGLRNTFHSQEMPNASFRYGAPAGSQYSNVSSRPTGYQPPLSTLPQHYHPCRPFVGNLRPQVPSWNHSAPTKPPCFDFRR